MIRFKFRIIREHLLRIVILLLLIIPAFFGCAVTGRNAYQQTHTSIVNGEITTLLEKYYSNIILPDGLFLYDIDPKTHIRSKEISPVRQLASSRILAVLSTNNAFYLDAHRRNYNLIMERFYEVHGNDALILNVHGSFGATAFAIRMANSSPFRKQYQSRLSNMVYTVLAHIGEDGRFFFTSTYQAEPNPVFEGREIFYSGELLVALAEYYQTSQDSKVLEKLKLAQQYYQKHFIDDIRKNFQSPYVPWHSQSLYLLYRITGDQGYARSLLRMQAYALNRNSFGYNLGIFHFNPWILGMHSSGVGVVADGLSYALEVAQELKDPGYNRIKNAYLMACQSLIRDYLVFPADMPDDPQYHGGIVSTRKLPTIRIDNIQHAWEALTRYRQLADQGYL